MTRTPTRTGARPGRARAGFGIVAVIVAGWILVVTLSIHAEPPRGEVDPASLAASTQRALEGRDPAALERLLDYPSGEARDFAGRYVDTIIASATAVRVSNPPGTDLVVISGRRADGQGFSYPVKAIADDDGRWILTFTPPL